MSDVAPTDECPGCKKRRERKTKAMQRRRARMGGKTRYPAADVKDIMALQGGKCVYCGVSLELGYHVDHIMPLIKGGITVRENLQLLCPTCNYNKGTKHPLDFALENGMLVLDWPYGHARRIGWSTRPRMAWWLPYVCEEIFTRPPSRPRNRRGRCRGWRVSGTEPIDPWWI